MTPVPKAAGHFRCATSSTRSGRLLPVMLILLLGLGTAAAAEVARRNHQQRAPAGPPSANTTAVPKAALATDVLVNDPDLDVGDVGISRTQNGTSIGVSLTSGTVCVAYNDSYHGVVEGTGYTGFSHALNGGASFIDGGAIGANSYGYPSLVWRAADNNFYLVTLHDSGLAVYRSITDCTSFGLHTIAHTGTGDDKEMLAVDNSAASLYSGRLYLVWTDFSAGNRIYLSSSDNTVNWSLPVAVSAVGATVTGAWPAVAPDGSVYVAWIHFQSYPYGLFDIQVAVSHNGGASFTQVADPLTDGIQARDSDATTACGRPALKGQIRHTSFPQIAVGPDGVVHVVYTRDVDGLDIGDPANVYYRRSTDGGTTWQSEVQLNDDSTLTSQWFPTLSVGASNVVSTAWYDRRRDPTDDLLFDYYTRRSTDGGVTWAASTRLSDVPSPIVLDPNIATCWFGDYDQQTQDPNRAYMVWGDDRLGSADVYFESLSTALFADGFESGTSGSWSQTVPSPLWSR